MGHGFTVLVGARNLADGETAAKSIGVAGHAIQLDVTNQASIESAASCIRDEFGRLDVRYSPRKDMALARHLFRRRL